MNNYESGKVAEFIARLVFLLKGYTILSKNFKAGRNTNIGEIDFIAKKGNYIVFAEVKKRTSLDLAAYAVAEKQKQRIIRGAQMFLKQKPQYKNCNVRFDVILIAFPFSVKHIKNAWSCEFVNYLRFF